MLRTSDASLAHRDDNPWHGKTVAQMLDQAETEHSGQVAIVDGNVGLTFADLRSSRDRLAGALAAAGVGEASHVAVVSEKSWEYAVLLHAIWSVGAVAVPLNSTWRRNELTAALVEADIDVLVAGRTSKDRSAADLLAELGIPGQGHVSIGHLPRLRCVIVSARGSEPGGRWHLQSMIARDAPPHRLSGQQESLFLFTSGSAAKPKCVMLRQDGLLGTACHFFDRLGVRTGDRFLSLGPYFHAGGIVQLLGANQSGATHYLFPTVEIPLVARVAIDESCTAVAGFDPVLARLFDEIEDLGAPLPFRSAGCAPGQAVRDRLAAQGVRPVMMYAMSEGGNMITISEPGDASAGNGRPLPGIDLRICAPDGGPPLRNGDQGEICFRGWNLFRGYYNLDGDQALTDADHYFRTGDIGRIDEAGRLHYLGRYSSMIKTGGENVSATEVEEFLVEEVQGVAAAAVIGVPDPTWGEAVVAFVEIAPGAEKFDAVRLKESCSGRLAGYKVPKRFVEMPSGSWPVSESGKLLRASLADLLERDM